MEGQRTRSRPPVQDSGAGNGLTAAGQVFGDGLQMRHGGLMEKGWNGAGV